MTCRRRRPGGYSNGSARSAWSTTPRTRVRLGRVPAHRPGLARRALAHELRHRGVDPSAVDQALDALDPDRELATARALVARRLPATRGLEPAARVRRLTGLLARKGYPGGLSYRVVREALAGEGLAADGVVEDQLAGLDTAEPD